MIMKNSNPKIREARRLLREAAQVFAFESAERFLFEAAKAYDVVSEVQRHDFEEAADLFERLQTRDL
jgi:hypothetical protein